MAGQALQFRFRGKVQHRAKPSWAGSTTSLGVFCLLILVWGKKKNFFFFTVVKKPILGERWLGCGGKPLPGGCPEESSCKASPAKTALSPEPTVVHVPPGPL